MKNARPLTNSLRMAVALERAEFLAESNRVAEAHAAYLDAICFDPGHQARCGYGEFLARLELHEQAAKQYSILLEESRRTGDMHLLAAAANNLACLYRDQGQYETAACFQQQAIRAECLTSEFDGPSAETLSNRASDAIAAGELTLAKDLLGRSLALQTADRSLEGQADDWGSLGVVAVLEGRLNHAVLYLWRAYRLHSRTGSTRRAGIDLLNLGEVFCRSELWQPATQCFRQAGQRFLQVRAWHSLEQANARLQEAEWFAQGAVTGRESAE